MGANEDNLVPQHRIRPRDLSEDIVAVEVILVEPGPDLDAQLWRSAGLDHPDQHIVMLRGQHHRWNGVARCVAEALNAHRAVFHGSGSEHCSSPKGTEPGQHVECRSRTGRPRKRGAPSLHRAASLGWLLPIVAEKLGLW